MNPTAVDRNPARSTRWVRRASWLGACGLTSLTLLGGWWASSALQTSTVHAQPPEARAVPPSEAAIAQARALVQADLANLTARFNPPARPAARADYGSHAGFAAPAAEPVNEPAPLASLVYNEELLTVLITRYDDHVVLRGWLIQPPAVADEADLLNEQFAEDDFAMPARLRIRQFGLKLDPTLDPFTRARLIQQHGLPPLIVGMVDSLIGPQATPFEEEIAPEEEFAPFDGLPEAEDADSEIFSRVNTRIQAHVTSVAGRMDTTARASSLASGASRVATASTASAISHPSSCLEGLAVASVDGQTRIEARYRDAHGQTRCFRAEGCPRTIEQAMTRDRLPQDARQAILRALPSASR